MSRSFADVWFWPVTAALLAAMALVQILSIRLECQTWDEGFEIASGYSYVRTGEYRISYEQPPLARVLAAIPLLWLNPEVPVNDPSWKLGQDREFGAAFLYHNRVPADSIVFAARMPTILTTLLLGLAIALWARRTFGAWTALGALLLFAFDPNVIANGRYVKNDMLVTLLAFLSTMAWAEYLRAGRRTWLMVTAITFGLALGAKFSAVFLLPVYVITWFSAAWQQRRAARPWQCFVQIAIVGLMGSAVLLTVYAPQWRKLIPATQAYRATHPEALRLGNAMTVATPRATAFLHWCTQLGLQDHPLLLGITRFLDHTSGGHEAYLLGQRSVTGWWYYFPVAFAVKTPVATLMALAMAGWIAVRRWASSAAGWLRSRRFEWMLLFVPIAVYVPMSMLNRVNTAERHVLPVYPFLFIAGAAILARVRWSRGGGLAMAVIAALLVIESASIHPHYLAFFNFAVGGPRAGSRYLLDANLDWGQDLLKLRSYWTRLGKPPLCMNYFGTADLDYYRIQHDWVPRTWQTEERANADCVAAVSATPLHDLYDKPGSMQWLREREPVARIGYSIYVYDLRKLRTPPLPAQ